MGIWSRIKGELAYKVLPRVVDFSIRHGCVRARKQLVEEGALSILVDVNVLGYGTTHVTRRIYTGMLNWGELTAPAFYTARVPMHDERKDSRILRCVRFLPSIASLSKEGLLILQKSRELQSEVNRQPTGRFYGYGYFDYNVFRDVAIESVDGFPMEDLLGLHDRSVSHQQRQFDRVHSSRDPLYQEIAAGLDSKDSLDAWHIRTAEKYGCYCFLTMDFKLRDKVSKRAHLEPFRSLRTKVMTPEELGRELKLMPISLRLLSFHRASFPVRPDLHAS